MLHCRGGDSALDQFDLLTAVMNWVEKGIAPESVVATARHSPAAAVRCARIRKYASYTGKGDPEDARNFVCRE